MKPVSRGDILDYQTYSENRAGIRAEAMRHKNARRIHLGDHLTFLFENRTTIRYQIQEMMRVERIVKEADILREIRTYNELLGGSGELGCTLLIEIETEAQRARLLRQWLPLPNHLYLKLEDGRKAHAAFDPRQVGEDRLSAVQYLKFDTGGAAPVAIGCDWSSLTVAAPLSADQRAALAADLADE